MVEGRSPCSSIISMALHRPSWLPVVTTMSVLAHTSWVGVAPRPCTWGGRCSSSCSPRRWRRRPGWPGVGRYCRAACRLGPSSTIGDPPGTCTWTWQGTRQLLLCLYITLKCK